MVVISIVTYASCVRVVVTLDASQGFVVVLDTSQEILPYERWLGLTYVRDAALLD